MGVTKRLQFCCVCRAKLIPTGLRKSILTVSVEFTIVVQSCLVELCVLRRCPNLIDPSCSVVLSSARVNTLIQPTGVVFVLFFFCCLVMVFQRRNFAFL